MSVYEVLVAYRVEKTFNAHTDDGPVGAEEAAREAVFFEGGDIEEIIEVRRISGDPHPDDDDYEEPEDDEEDDEGDWFMDDPDLGAR